MPQDPDEQLVAKVLHRYPEIVELTEARKRAIAGGRASIETALSRMIEAAKRPYNTVLEYNDRDPDEPAKPETPADRALRQQQALIEKARLAAEAAQARALETAA